MERVFEIIEDQLHLTWLGNQVDFMSMIGKEVDYRELEAHANQDT